MSAPASGRQTGSFGDELTNAALIALVGMFGVALVLRAAGSVAAFLAGTAQPAAGPASGLGVLFNPGDPAVALDAAAGLNPVVYWIVTTLLLAALVAGVAWVWMLICRHNRKVETDPHRLAGIATTHEVKTTASAKALLRRAGNLRPSLTTPAPDSPFHHCPARLTARLPSSAAAMPPHPPPLPATSAPHTAPGWMARALHHRSFALGAVLVALLLACAALSLVWTPWSPYAMDLPAKLQAPSAQHWLGTDAYGRDIASQLLVGARSTLAVGLVAVGLGLLLGTALGLLAAARRGWVEQLTLRLADFSLAFPALLTAILLSAVRGPGLGNAVLAIALLNIPIFARLARASAASVWAQNYVLAARACGKSRWRITWEHILPHCAGVLMAQASSQFALAILAEAALSYLGLGLGIDTPSLGLILSKVRGFFLDYPYLLVFPASIVSIISISFYIMGNALSDAADPRNHV